MYFFLMNRDPFYGRIIRRLRGELDDQLFEDCAADLLRSTAVRVTRIATGVPAGSDIEYADEVTMTRAMEGRRELKF